LLTAPGCEATVVTTGTPPLPPLLVTGAGAPTAAAGAVVDAPSVPPKNWDARRTNVIFLGLPVPGAVALLLPASPLPLPPGVADGLTRTAEEVAAEGDAAAPDAIAPTLAAAGVAVDDEEPVVAAEMAMVLRRRNRPGLFGWLVTGV